MVTKDNLILLIIATVLIAVGIFLFDRIVDSKFETHDQVVAMAEDLGCTYIEQSYHHRENYYIDCGDDNIRIIKVEK